MNADPLPGPRGLDNLGYLRRLLRDPVPVLDELAGRYGPSVALGWGPARLAIVGEPAAVTQLLTMDPALFKWGHKFNVLGFVVGSSSLLVSDGPDHRRRRRAVTPGFARRRLNGWIPMIVAETDAAIARLLANSRGPDDHADLYPMGRSLVLRVVVRAMFGDSLASRSDEIGELFQRPQAYLESPALRQLPHRLPFTARARVRADRRALDAIIDVEIAARRTAPDRSGSDVLMALVDSGDLDDAEIRDQVVTLIGAGYDSTSSVLAWVLLRSASAPGLWGRLREEADAVFVDDAAPFDHGLVGRLVLADAVVRETLRLHPAGVVSPREAVSDLELGGYRVPAGTLILWSPYLSGRDPCTWNEPLAFDPMRFTALSAQQHIAAEQGWVPFGGGARNCIGFALAQMELTVILARIAQHLDVKRSTDLIPAPRGMVVNRPTGGAVMHVRARS